MRKPAGNRGEDENRQADRRVIDRRHGPPYKNYVFVSVNICRMGANQDGLWSCPAVLLYDRAAESNVAG